MSSSPPSPTRCESSSSVVLLVEDHDGYRRIVRWALRHRAVTMGVAFFLAHGGKLTGQGNGEMAFLYLGAYVVLFLTGGGRFAVDAKLGGKS